MNRPPTEGDFALIRHSHAFDPGSEAAFDDDFRLGNFEVLCQDADQALVGSSVDGSFSQEYGQAAIGASFH